MNLRYHLGRSMENIQKSIADYESIRVRQEVQKDLETKKYVESKLSGYLERLEIIRQCLHMYDYLEHAVDKEVLTKILKGEMDRN